jgi:hypothetical protein
MQKASVKKGVGYKLPQVRPNRGEHKLVSPGTKKLDSRCKWGFMRRIRKRKNKDVSDYQAIVRIWRPPGPDICSNWKYQQHSLSTDFKIKAKGRAIVKARNSGDKI